MNASSSSFAATITTVEAAAVAVTVRIAVDRGKEKNHRCRNFLKERSLAPSIFNIKARGLAHCLHWIKLIENEVYEVHFKALAALSDDVVKNNFDNDGFFLSSSWFFFRSTALSSP